MKRSQLVNVLSCLASACAGACHDPETGCFGAGFVHLTHRMFTTGCNLAGVYYNAHAAHEGPTVLPQPEKLPEPVRYVITYTVLAWLFRNRGLALTPSNRLSKNDGHAIDIANIKVGTVFGQRVVPIARHEPEAHHEVEHHEKHHEKAHEDHHSEPDEGMEVVKPYVDEETQEVGQQGSSADHSEEEEQKEEPHMASEHSTNPSRAKSRWLAIE
eukprot:4795715-Pyramimonas_sp.AAC.1